MSEKARDVEQRLEALVAGSNGTGVTSIQACINRTISSVGPVPVTSAVTLGTGTWRICGMVIANPATSAGASAFTWSGSVGVGSFRSSWVELGSGTPGGVGNVTDITTIGGQFLGATFGTANRVYHHDGLLSVTSAGTLVLNAATTVTADHFDVIFGSYLQIIPANG